MNKQVSVKEKMPVSITQQTTKCNKGSLKDGATLAFFEESFCRNLKTNQVKYIKVYVLRNEIQQGVYLL